MPHIAFSRIAHDPEQSDLRIATPSLEVCVIEDSAVRLSETAALSVLYVRALSSRGVGQSQIDQTLFALYFVLGNGSEFVSHVDITVASGIQIRYRIHHPYYISVTVWL